MRVISRRKLVCHVLDVKMSKIIGVGQKSYHIAIFRKNYKVRWAIPNNNSAKWEE